jgi:hypothetical protein
MLEITDGRRTIRFRQPFRKMLSKRFKMNEEKAR